MRREEFDIINKVENTHWWYVGTREICASIMKRFAIMKKSLKKAPGNNARVLDIGCGTGGNIEMLSEFGKVDVCDIDKYTLEICKRKGINAFVFDMENSELPTNTYDLITMFDVLNQAQIKNHDKIMQKINRSLVKSGYFATREPAMKIAGGRHDIEVNIIARFEKEYFRKLIERNGFKVVYVSYLNTLLFPAIVLSRKLGLLLNKTPKSDVYMPNPMINTILLAILRMEKFLINFTTFPFGVSIFVIAQKS